jgi:methylated-DNA-protein-cysteine methyltransferase-like protein
MPRTDEAEAFFHAVYSAIQEIPYGKVTSYGHIARLIGTRKLFPMQDASENISGSWICLESLEMSERVAYGECKSIKLMLCTAQRPRQVGVCLKHLSNDLTITFHDGNVPWQRVINSKGGISPR